MSQEAGVDVDVAVPTHGEGLYLREALVSVLAQTHPRLTLFVSDNYGDGIGPATAVVDALGDDRIEYSATGGIPPHENWTRCFELGSARYVSLLPHDEYWDPEFLARRVAFLEEHPQCAFVFSACRVINSKGEQIDRPSHPLREGVVQPAESLPMFFERNLVPTCSILIRRSAYEAVAAAGFDPAARMGMDWEMWLRMAARFPIGYLKLRDNAARVHGQSVSAASLRWGDMHLQMIRRAEELIANEQPDLVLPAGLRERRMIYAYVKSGLDALDEGDVTSAQEFLRAALRIDRGAVLDPRGAALAAGILGGAPSRRLVSRMRVVESRVQLRHRLSRLAMSVGQTTGAHR